jgi:Ca2+/Na+ antiporter
MQETGKKAGKKFYWVEGVTRDEVVKSLADQQPTRLRDQKVRRGLVLVHSVLATLIAISHLFGGTKLRTYLEAFILAGLLYLYFILRRSVRHIADAPDELLDERLIGLRNAAYLSAYRYMFGVTILLFSLGHWLLRNESGISATRPSELWQGPIFSFLILAMSLPSMVLAWTLPSEKSE